MRKFNKGDKCKVVKNLLAPECVGDIVEVTGWFSVRGRNYYRILEEGMKGIASEGCLELVKE